MNYKNTLIILLFSLNLQLLSQANIDKNNITEDLNKAKLKSELRASRKIE